MSQQDFTDDQISSGTCLQPLLHPQARRSRPATLEKSVLAERGAGAVRTRAPGRHGSEGDRDRTWSGSGLPQPDHPEIRRDGLITRKPLPSDRRQYRLSLTAKGRQAFARLDRCSHDDVAAMLATLPRGDGQRLIAAMAAIERLLGASREKVPPAILRGPRPGDMGWVVQSHGSLYARRIRFGLSFEALVAEIAAKFLASFDASRERCWIAEIDGAPVGSVFLVRHTDDVAKLRLLLVEPAGRGHGVGRRLSGRMHPFGAGLRLSQDHAMDPEHPGRRAQDLSGRRIALRCHRAASQFRPRSLIGETREPVGVKTRVDEGPPRRIIPTRGVSQERASARASLAASRSLGCACTSEALLHAY